MLGGMGVGGRRGRRRLRICRKAVFLGGGGGRGWVGIILRGLYDMSETLCFYCSSSIFLMVLRNT